MDEVCGDREQQATDRPWWAEILRIRYECDLSLYQQLKNEYGVDVRPPYPFQ